MNKTEKAVAWALDTAKDPAHGYDQRARWGPDYDCSSFVITAWQQAGVPVKQAGATYTGNMRAVFRRCGFVEVTDGTLLRGDVLLNEKRHAALYVGDGWLVQACANEHGGVTGGESGDQSSGEIAVRGYYSFPWDCVLRYAGEGGGEAGESGGSCRVTLPILRRGDMSGTVLSMQLLLIRRWSADCGPDGADGSFGPNTERAVRDFQRRRALEADGECGRQTWAALLG